MTVADLSSIFVAMASLGGCPLVLIGDPAQPAAQVRSAYARALGVELSTLERTVEYFAEAPATHVALEDQYRSVPVLSSFVSSAVYQGRLFPQKKLKPTKNPKSRESHQGTRSTRKPQEAAKPVTTMITKNPPQDRPEPKRGKSDIFLIFFHFLTELIKDCQKTTKKLNFSKKNIFEKPHCRAKLEEKSSKSHFSEKTKSLRSRLVGQN